MNRVRKAGIAAAMVGTTLTGGAIGAALFNGGSAGAATGSSTSTPSPSSSGGGSLSAAPSGAFHSNENASHEATESPQREAQENAGQAPTVP
jgi:hypothetical protein